MAVEPLDKTEKVLAYLLTSNSAVPMAMEPSISMATSEGESEVATPSPYEKTHSGTLPQGRVTIKVS